jgi:hypothetical protein
MDGYFDQSALARVKSSGPSFRAEHSAPLSSEVAVFDLWRDKTGLPGRRLVEPGRSIKESLLDRP